MKRIVIGAILFVLALLGVADAQVNVQATAQAFAAPIYSINNANNPLPPSIASNACGSTTQGTLSSPSTDTSGYFTIGTATVTSCAISFGSRHAQAPNACVLQPMNAAAAAQGTTGAYVSALSTTGFTVTGALLDSAEYGYHCI